MPVTITYAPGEIEHSGDVAREVSQVEDMGGKLIKEQTIQDGPYDLQCYLTVEFPTEELYKEWRAACGWFFD